MKIDNVIDKLDEILKAEADLSDVLNHHKVNGMLPDIGKSISIGCERVRYSTYTNSKDEAKAELLIYAYLQEADPEAGEKEARNMAEVIRLCLNENQTLSGIISASEIDEIEYIYADASDTMFWHAAIIHLQATYYEDKKRPVSGTPIEAINNQIEKESD